MNKQYRIIPLLVDGSNHGIITRTYLGIEDKVPVNVGTTREKAI